MESGLRLTERYHLLERLDGRSGSFHGGSDARPSGARGTMEVWRGRDELLGRPVTVKLLASGRADLRHAFQEGVNRAAGLSHPSLEMVYDSDQARDAYGRRVSYVVTESLDGETLAARLRHGPLRASEALDVCARIAGALAAAHAAGVAHGGLTTGRVMLAGGAVKVMDTGIGGMVRGTADAPEAPAAARTLDQAKAADVRALGTIIAACLPTGTSGEPASVAMRCLGATAEGGPSAAEVAGLLDRDGAPSNAVFAAGNGPRRRRWGGTAEQTRPSRAPSGHWPSRDHRQSGHRPTDDYRPTEAYRPANDYQTRTLGPPPRRPRRGTAGRRLAAVALVVAIPVTAAVALLVSAPRSPVIVPPSSATSTARAAGGVTRVTDALGQLRPIVSRGYASGEIRSDVATDLNNAITALENDLTADRKGRVNRRNVNRGIARLKAKIVTRLRERGLSREVADELNRVLATIQT